MARFFVFTFSLIMFTLLGCRTTSPVILNEHSISFEEVQEVARRHHAHIHSMSGEGRISIETPQVAQSGSFILTLQKPDSVLITLQGPFGMKVGSALVTRTEFFFYNSLENKLFTGLSNEENLNRILHIHLSFDDLLSLFAGGTFLESDFRAPDEIHIEDNQYVFVFTSEKTTRKYWVDPATLFIQKIHCLDRNGKLVLEQTFSNFEDANGFAMPYTIRILQPKERQQLTISYSDIAINTEKLQFTFTIPPNAERIHW
jgi:outer membrane lipoprotein-sorting protein